MTDTDSASPSMRRQCELLDLCRSSIYYDPIPESEENLLLMKEIDRLHLEYPFYGKRRMTAVLRKADWGINVKRVRRLMLLLGIEAFYPKPNTTVAGEGHKKYPYLLRGVTIDRVNQVWSTDITYVPMHRGYLYLTAVIDWYSRYVLAWKLSNSLEMKFCIDTLLRSFEYGLPEIFNTDQGVQYTSSVFTEELKSRGISISMDGKGRALDNIFVERLWRSVKQEEIYLKSYESGIDAYENLAHYFEFYNNERPHQSLGYRTPREFFLEGIALRKEEKYSSRVENAI